MKSVTVAVIFAAIVVYANTYNPPTSDVPRTSAFTAISSEDPAMLADPDDDEDEDRVSVRRRKLSAS
jgi:hypothetical protein